MPSQPGAELEPKVEPSDPSELTHLEVDLLAVDLMKGMTTYRRPNSSTNTSQGPTCTFVYYEWLLGNDKGPAVAKICRSCKEDAVSQRTVRRWFNRFESGDTSLDDRELNGRPSMMTNSVTIDSTYSATGLLDPHRLTDKNKQSRIADLVTGDETWVLYDNVARHAVWIPREEEPPTTPKADLLPLKIMLYCWTVTIFIYTDQLEKLAHIK
ncbi:unnamed protein product [Caenorhabditis auriculariae]|uniref:Mos1 transposase HTH domain-containing protein n=1 Tax=Caenorhabditis auriculariae TaxID=2777116 RepID=A0A8S1HNZ4_9PELO|nr:unnamed protein product [Caenorhabditis auriculariae]